jgi:hypothetical protein
MANVFFYNSKISFAKFANPFFFCFHQVAKICHQKKTLITSVKRGKNMICFISLKKNLIKIFPHLKTFQFQIKHLLEFGPWLLRSQHKLKIPSKLWRKVFLVGKNDQNEMADLWKKTTPPLLFLPSSLIGHHEIKHSLKKN